MAKKASKSKRASKSKKTTKRKKSRSKEGGPIRFSLVAMHKELQSVLDRLQGIDTDAAKELRAKVQSFKRDTGCGQTMIPEL